MREMTQVARYVCRWCGQEFRTPDRHVCKWDTDCRNCLSCRHRGMFVKGEPTRPVGFGTWEEGCASGFVCNRDGGPFEPGEGGLNDFPYAQSAHPGRTPDGRELRCKDHVLIEGYEGKKTYARIERERERDSRTPNLPEPLI